MNVSISPPAPPIQTHEHTKHIYSAQLTDKSTLNTHIHYTSFTHLEYKGRDDP